MKIRAGFVSNSSSSSFCIYGTYCDNLEDLKKKFKTEDTYKLEEIIEKKGLFTSRGPDNYTDGLYIGRKFSTIKNDETGLQFKQSTESLLKELFGEEIKGDILVEAWRDG